MIFRSVLPVALILLWGCKPPAEPIKTTSDYTGAWVVDGGTFSSQVRTRSSLRDFRLTLYGDGRFTVLNWPSDWFRLSSVPTVMSGKWIARYSEGYNYVRLEFSAFGEYAGSVYDMVPRFRVAGTLLRIGNADELIYLRRATEGEAVEPPDTK